MKRKKYTCCFNIDIQFTSVIIGSNKDTNRRYINFIMYYYVFRNIKPLILSPDKILKNKSQTGRACICYFIYVSLTCLVTCFIFRIGQL